MKQLHLDSFRCFIVRIALHHQCTTCWFVYDVVVGSFLKYHIFQPLKTQNEWTLKYSFSSWRTTLHVQYGCVKTVKYPFLAPWISWNTLLGHMDTYGVLYSRASRSDQATSWISNVHARICKACQIIGMSQNYGSKFALSPTFCLVNGAKVLVNECSRESCFQLELILCDKAGKCAKTLPIQLHFFANCRSIDSAHWFSQMKLSEQYGEMVFSILFSTKIPVEMLRSGPGFLECSESWDKPDAIIYTWIHEGERLIWSN